ncbi:hypothetical protein H696_01436 [Fonticula alba]|uniref:Uncharacterized protein n=1 Tax=Fonticula alba TaxID=691883 RepID=A0A058ZC96_FONAL|nr:hypothetical protein H696_01436 [Fonticula alba]KCV72030.1 hypothetical protein H696_01436 [Fonticula alba]|eukprot:XP_009493608.1 hypothetical protein H696_01436 [Fonticula alba]
MAAGHTRGPASDAAAGSRAAGRKVLSGPAAPGLYAPTRGGGARAPGTGVRTDAPTLWPRPAPGSSPQVKHPDPKCADSLLAGIRATLAESFGQLAGPAPTGPGGRLAGGKRPHPGDGPCSASKRRGRSAAVTATAPADAPGAACGAAAPGSDVLRLHSLGTVNVAPERRSVLEACATIRGILRQYRDSVIRQAEQDAPAGPAASGRLIQQFQAFSSLQGQLFSTRACLSECRALFQARIDANHARPELSTSLASTEAVRPLAQPSWLARERQLIRLARQFKLDTDGSFYGGDGGNLTVFSANWVLDFTLPGPTVTFTIGTDPSPPEWRVRANRLIESAFSFNVANGRFDAIEASFRKLVLSDAFLPDPCASFAPGPGAPARDLCDITALRVSLEAELDLLAAKTRDMPSPGDRRWALFVGAPADQAANQSLVGLRQPDPSSFEARYVFLSAPALPGERIAGEQAEFAFTASVEETGACLPSVFRLQPDGTTSALAETAAPRGTLFESVDPPFSADDLAAQEVALVRVDVPPANACPLLWPYASGGPGRPVRELRMVYPPPGSATPAGGPAASAGPVLLLAPAVPVVPRLARGLSRLADPLHLTPEQPEGLVSTGTGPGNFALTLPAVGSLLARDACRSGGPPASGPGEAPHAELLGILRALLGRRSLRALRKAGQGGLVPASTPAAAGQPGPGAGQPGATPASSGVPLVWWALKGATSPVGPISASISADLLAALPVESAAPAVPAAVPMALAISRVQITSSVLAPVAVHILRQQVLFNRLVGSCLPAGGRVATSADGRQRLHSRPAPPAGGAGILLGCAQLPAEGLAGPSADLASLGDLPPAAANGGESPDALLTDQQAALLLGMSLSLGVTFFAGDDPSTGSPASAEGEPASLPDPAGRSLSFNVFVLPGGGIHLAAPGAGRSSEPDPATGGGSLLQEIGAELARTGSLVHGLAAWRSRL